MRFRRRLGMVLIVLGALTLAYAAATLLWRDPATDLYARWKQQGLAEELDRTFAAYRDEASDESMAANPGAQRRAVARAAREFRRDVVRGRAIGRLVIPKLGLDTVFVHGTRWGPDLSKGPGHYERTPLPGLGGTTGIAGHRTTFGAPFRHIDDLARGDEVVVELPYGTFTYRVAGHEIVKSNDWSVIEPRGYDAIMLSACHPLYSAKQRWIVYGRLTSVEPVGGQPYELGRDGAVVASG